MVKYIIKVDGITHLKEKRAAMKDYPNSTTKFFYEYAIIGIWKTGTKENPRGMMKPRFIIDLAFDKLEANEKARKAEKKYMNVEIVPCSIDETKAVEERRKQKDKEYKAQTKKNKMR